MAKKKVVKKTVSASKYKKLLDDFVKLFSINQKLLATIKNTGIHLSEPEYLETYNYNLNMNMTEMHSLINKAVSSSPQHIKNVESGTSSIMSLPDEIMQSERIKAEIAKEQK